VREGIESKEPGSVSTHVGRWPSVLSVLGSEAIARCGGNGGNSVRSSGYSVPGFARPRQLHDPDVVG